MHVCEIEFNAKVCLQVCRFVYVCMCVRYREHLCAIQCNLFPVTVVRRSQVVCGLMTLVTWEEEKQGWVIFFF